MTDVLARIVARKRQEVVDRKTTIAQPPPSTRSLKAALGRPGARFIMEVKRRSPSGHRGRHSVGAAAAAYAPIADSISVLTDGADFGGSIDDIAAVRAHFDGPILAKDFVVDPFQVTEARAAGADAVLAMLSVLDDPAAADVIAEARRLAMDVVVEVHDERELNRALRLGADIVGINNRDLRTLRTDLSVTERIAPKVPAGVLLVSESGIGGIADVRRLAPLVDGFLVGSSLMASDHIAEEARALVRGRVKICGLTREDDVEAAARFGATHAGLILVPGTPRALTADRAEPLAALARRLGLRAVGIFRDEEPEKVTKLACRLRIEAVQLHGSEDESFVAALRSSLPRGVEIWASRGVSGRVVEPRRPADRTLFDTSLDGQCGGTGTPFDWTALDGHADLPFAFLSGGIGPANAGKAAEVGAFGLDLSSGVECAPGLKDHAKLAALSCALRPTSRSDS